MSLLFYAQDKDNRDVVINIVKNGSDEHKIYQTLLDCPALHQPDKFPSVIPVLQIIPCSHNFSFVMLPRYYYAFHFFQPSGAAMSRKASRMILAPWSRKDASKCFPLPTWFPGQLEELVLWIKNQKREASVDDCVSFPRKLPRAHTLTICGDDLDIRQAAGTASHKEGISISLRSGSTTGKQVVGSQKYFQRVQSLLMPGGGPPDIFPTAMSEWMSS